MKELVVVGLAVVVFGSILALPRADAAVPQPFNLYGIARDFAGNPLPFTPNPTRITGFVDGVDYSNGTSVYSAAGNYDIDVAGNWMTNTGQPNTPWIKEGADIGEQIMYVAGDMTTTGQVFTITIGWAQGDTQSRNIGLANPTTQPALIKIARIVTRPADGLSQYLYLCNPTSQPVNAANYYLERDSPGTVNGPTHALVGTIPPGGLLYVNETAWTAPGAPNVNGDNLKLVWTNNGSAFGTANIVVDRVEFNATIGGSLTWEPGQTIMPDAAAPGLGREIRRTLACGDTNNNQIDFTDAAETGRPSTNTPPTFTVVSPNGGEDWSGNSVHSVVWDQTDAQDTTLSVTAEYSTDNQATWLVIYSSATEPNGRRTHPWTVPCVDTTQAWVRVRGFDSGGLTALDLSNGPFTIDCRQPALINTNPLNLATGIAVTQAVILTFNETMNQTATQTATTIAPAVSGISYAWSTTTFPSDTLTISHNNFNGNTLYTVTVSCVAKDVSDPGNQLAACPRSFSFTTVITDIAPSVVLTSPVGGEDWTGGTVHNLVFTTTDPDDLAGVAMDLFYSTDAGTTWIRINATFQLVPAAHSLPWTVPSVNTLTARVRVCATDTANPQVCQSSPANFQIDSTRPTVIGNSPTGANDVPLTAPIVVTFSETMSRSNTQPAFRLGGISGVIYQWSTVTVVDDRVTLTHNDLATCTNYTINIVTSASDISDPGNTFAANFTWTFRTVCAPTVVVTAPAAGVIYSGGSTQTIRFRADDSDAQVYVWINVSTDGGNTWIPLAGVVGQGTQRSTGQALAVTGTMPNVDTTTARIQVTAQDSTRLNGITVSASFTIDATPPTITSSVPANGATGVTVTAAFTITFSEAMNASETEAAISLSPGTWTLTYSWNPNGNVVTINHQALSTNTTYTISVSTRAKDVSLPGNALATAGAISFTTAATGAVTANAGPDQSGETGVTLTLDGSGSTGAITNYTWSIALPGGGTDTRYGRTTTYQFNAAGTYTVTLTVRDAASNSATDTAIITITAKATSDFLSQYWWLILILIIAIVAALLFLVLGKRRKKQEPDEEEAPPAPMESKPAAPPKKGAAPAAKGSSAPGNTMPCPSCGTIVDKTDKECFMCGTALS